jgi:hypothetical protein
MAWETALDRLVLQQVHLAEKGERRAEEVQRLLRDLHDLNPRRPESAFHLGYARIVIGADVPEPRSAEARRWFTFGRLRAHDRRGERNWVAEALADQAQLVDLLSEPRIAAQFLPVAMRVLFWCGDLDVAVRAIDFLASTGMDDDTALLVEAALSDLLTRLEHRVDAPDRCRSSRSASASPRSSVCPRTSAPATCVRSAAACSTSASSTRRARCSSAPSRSRRRTSGSAAAPRSASR